MRSSIAAIGAALPIGRFCAAAGAANADLMSAARMSDGTYAVVLLAHDGAILRTIPLSDRGHDFAIDPVRGLAVAFARRPGYFALAFSLAGRAEPVLFAPPDDRHFFGHGAFSRDGRLVYATENDIDTGNGIIGIYETTSWRRVGEFPSYGLGPHEAVLLDDGRTLAIANGGFATEPSSGREPIDLSSMEPSLAFVDVTTGELMAKHGLPESINLLSIRHLAADSKGQVWFGAQWQGNLEASPELIGSASLDRSISIVETGPPQGTSLKGYIGSVALCAQGRMLAASAPRAGRILLIDTETGKTIAEKPLRDGCGVSPFGQNAFALTSGHGDLVIEATSGVRFEAHTVPGVEFDNHLRWLPRV